MSTQERILIWVLIAGLALIVFLPVRLHSEELDLGAALKSAEAQVRRQTEMKRAHARTSMAEAANALDVAQAVTLPGLETIGAALEPLPFRYQIRKSGGWPLLTLTVTVPGCTNFVVQACTNALFSVTNAAWTIRNPAWPWTNYLQGFNEHLPGVVFGPPSQLFWAVLIPR